jgi:hypothetical protein
MQRDPLRAFIWWAVHSVYILSTAYDKSMVAAPASRGTHEKTKQLPVIFYKTCANKRDQLLTYYYSFQSQLLKWQEKLFNLFDLVLVNVHILHRMIMQEFWLYHVFEKVAEGLVTWKLKSWSSHRKVLGQGMYGRDHSAFRIPAMGTKQTGKNQHMC